MLNNAFHFLITTLADILTFALLLRFLLQYVGAPIQNPLSQMAMSLTNFIVKPARRFIPSWKGIDISTVLLAWAVQILAVVIIGVLSGGLPHQWLGVILITGIDLIRLTLDIFFYAILIQAILSWVNPVSPLSGVLFALTNPILKPIRRFLPVTSGIDFSSLVALILLQMLNTAVIRDLKMQIIQFF